MDTTRCTCCAATDSVLLCVHECRDAEGHGTHVAGTAVGNYGIVPSSGAPDGAVISGIAPRARLAVYKVGSAVNDLGAVGHLP